MRHLRSYQVDSSESNMERAKKRTKACTTEEARQLLEPKSCVQNIRWRSPFGTRKAGAQHASEKPQRHNQPASSHHDSDLTRKVGLQNPAAEHHHRGSEHEIIDWKGFVAPVCGEFVEFVWQSSWMVFGLLSVLRTGTKSCVQISVNNYWKCISSTIDGLPRETGEKLSFQENQPEKITMCWPWNLEATTSRRHVPAYEVDPARR